MNNETNTGIDLSFLRVGDTVRLSICVYAEITVCYCNGGDYFVRFAVIDPIDGKRMSTNWNEGDTYCCRAGWPRNGKLSNWGTPWDIVEIIKPPIHVLQDRIKELEHKLGEKI